MRPTDVIHWSDELLLGRLIAQGVRANLLVISRGLGLDRIADYFAKRMPAPVSTGIFPGELRLPGGSTRVWLLRDVAFMSATQQAEVADWLATGGAAVQVVSLASEPLWPMVVTGRFRESLYYRLNTIVCEAMPADARPNYDEVTATC